jgi:hypothetical protein
MTRIATWAGFAVLGAVFTVPTWANDAPRATVDAALAALAGAEDQFEEPSSTWFDETHATLRQEAERVSMSLEAHDPAVARAWKEHLRWELLERNLRPLDSVDVAELAVVRRWMYSNREGLEWEFFAPLRAAMDQYLDAAFTLSHADLRGEYAAQLSQLRQQIAALAAVPNDANAAALGRTLGWFERTRQLPNEVSEVKRLLSKPNAVVAVDVEVIRRIMASQAPEVSATVSLVERVEAARTNPLQRRRTIVIRGDATTSGTVRLLPVPNDEHAEFQLVYEGDVETAARGTTGPVTLNLSVTGTAQATKSVTFGRDGLQLGPTDVIPQVQPRLDSITASNELIEWIARRRATHPDARAQMNSQARETAVEQLRLKFDESVEEAIASLRSDFQRIQGSLGEMQDATAPLAREGAEPYFAGAQSDARGARLNSVAQQRGQFGAATPCPVESISADVVVGIHASFFNNMAETITGGKTLSDRFIMKYAKVLHAELPLPLMVHTRAPRWALTMAKHRPLAVEIAAPDRVTFRVRVDAVEIGGATTPTNAIATISYRIQRDQFGDYFLQRQGDLALDAHCAAATAEFLREKLDAFFGPVLNGGGVIVPEGGALGAMQRLQWQGLRADGDWLVVGWNIPAEAVDSLMQLTQPRVAQAPAP